MSFENENSIVTELVQYTENEGDIHQRTVIPTITNLATKKAQGKYDSGKAIQAFMYVAEAGARKYAKDFGSDARSWHDTFPVSVRHAAATHWRDEFEAEFALGNYDDLLPKKYQKTRKGSKMSRLTTSAYHAHDVGDEVWWWSSSGNKLIGTVVKIHFVGDRPDYEVMIQGADSVVMKAEHELASETGRKRLAAETKTANRRKRRKR
jgi:hypothetical protein